MKDMVLNEMPPRKMEKTETEIQVRKQMLDVYSDIDPQTGKPVINWEYGEKINAYFLIGILEDIKLEVLSHIDHEEGEFQ